MPVERFYSPSALAEKSLIDLNENEFHHLVHVIRAKEGDLIELVNGLGVLAKGQIKTIKKSYAEIMIEKSSHAVASSCPLMLFQAFCQQNKLDFILEKGSELGVDRFYFFPGEQSGKKEWFPSQSERAKAVTIAALKQSGRLFLPQISLLPKIQEWKEIPRSTFYGDISPSAPSLWNFLSSQKGLLLPPLSFVTGPESGFTKNETQKLEQLGAKGVSLHENILRSETASLSALSLLSAYQLSMMK